MKPGKKVVTDTLEIGSSTKLLDEIEENENKMKLQRKTESRKYDVGRSSRVGSRDGAAAAAAAAAVADYWTV